MPRQRAPHVVETTAVLAGLAGVPSAASAVGFGDPALPCKGPYEAAVAADPFLATVTAPSGGRVHFVRGKTDMGKTDKDSSCPSLAAGCRMAAYLVAGNKVLVSSANDDFACVHFATAPDKFFSGLVPTSGLKFDSMGRVNGDYALDAPDALGSWNTRDATIVIKRGGDGYVLLEGDASRGPPSYNTGEIAGPAYLGSEGKSTAGYTDEHYVGDVPPDARPETDATSCRVRLRRFGPYLLVDDNDHCGGNAVTFSGLYVKR